MITINTVPFAIYRHGGNKAEYLGPNHTDVIKDVMYLRSASPKLTSTSYGNRRSSVNDIHTVAIDTPNGDTENRDLKFEIVGSVPVGTSDADVDAALVRLVDKVSDTTFMKETFVQGRIVK